MHEPIPQEYPYPVPRRRPVAWVNWTIVGSTVVVFLLQLLELHLTGDDVIGNTLAFSPQAFADHRYWTLVTYACGRTLSPCLAIRASSGCTSSRT